MRHVITHGVITVQDERKTSRSQEIDVNSFHEEPGSSKRKPVNETSVIQARSSEDRKDFNVEQAHERTGRSIITHDVITVSNSSQTRSIHDSETFDVGDKTLRERTGRSVIDHDDFNGERGGHGLPNSRTTTFRCEACAEYQRSRINSKN